MESVFFEPAGPGTFRATPATAGPWYEGVTQHGGPPSALAARALELHEPEPGKRLGRVTVDILRPVPVTTLSLRTRTVRAGRRVSLLETVMEADGQEVLQARGWRIERPSGEVPEITDGSGPPEPVPDAGAGLPPHIFRRYQDGYLGMIEWRFLASGLEEAGGQPGTPGPVRSAWSRPRIPLLPDAEPSAMSRTLLVADTGSGIGAALPMDDYLYINVDLTVVLPRDPVGEWIRLEASTRVGTDGTGLATTRLHDQAGSFGNGWQTLLVAPR